MSAFTHSWEVSHKQHHVFHGIIKKMRLEGTSGDYLVQPPARRGADFKVKSGLSNYHLLKLSEIEAASFQWRGTAAKMIKIEDFGHQNNFCYSVLMAGFCSCLSRTDSSRLCPSSVCARYLFRHCDLVLLANIFDNKITTQRCFQSNRRVNTLKDAVDTGHQKQNAVLQCVLAGAAFEALLLEQSSPNLMLSA